MRHDGAGAGQRYAKLFVTNKSGQACTIFGYGGLQLLDSAGNPTPTTLSRTPNPGPALVTLRPGETAKKKLHWSQVAHGDEPATEPCQRESTSATVIPPDDTQAFQVTYPFGNVCGKGSIEGSAFYKG
ncbi:uncharacterized protein DUF4232 [Herbihabitans rhizosphaerae]|uniref:Uncharacterized protein DUF4232 n=1 Tax=Herbihabitans rhizosphaerae TaxID=1872711 RepID=A0A4Q7L566_9PSEU|nr:uncharacterized protein DUF4232 [Herbihabitans rhizosphaerae]